MGEKEQQQLIQYIAILRRGNDQQKAQVRQLAEQNDQIAATAVNISDAADQGNQQANQMVAQVEAMIDGSQRQSQNNNVSYAKMGAKLNYLKKLSGNCPEGYEIVYMKQGSKIIPIKRCKKCEQERKMSAVEEFKCGGKKKKK